MQGFNFALKFQDKKHGGNLIDRQSGFFDKIIRGRRVVSEGFYQQLIVIISIITQERTGFGSFVILHKMAGRFLCHVIGRLFGQLLSHVSGDRSELADNVIRAFDQFCALANQLMTSA